MPVPHFLGVAVTPGLHPRLRGDLEDVVALLADRKVDPLPLASKEGAGDVHAQQAVLVKERQADLVRLQLPRRIVEHLEGEEAFLLGLVDRRALVKLLQDSPQLLRGLVALQAHFALVATVSVLERDVVLALIVGEAMQTVSDDEFRRELFTLELDFMARQVAQVVGHTFMLERLPLLDGVDLKFWQAHSSSTSWVRARFYTKKTVRLAS